MEKIQTSKQKIEFKELLLDSEINKILFSGKFGTGKTTFLRDFFIDYPNDFTPIFLYPVNYSVANNEDIFEYVKYDILIKLLEWDNIEDYITDISTSIAAQVLFLDNPKDFILKLVKSYSSTCSVIEKIDSFLNGTKLLKEELDKYKESAQIDNFLTELSQNKGSLFEKNLITNIIIAIIQRWKETNPTKKICLVIDDLDRIDPEHIFRIMNVFAAHNDIEEESKNKFGFDRIVTVCDINNIQNIFFARYGVNTDFNGYISKFHSKSIFYFDFTKEIISQLDTIFSKYSVMDNHSLINDFNFFYKDRFKPIISELIQYGLITIRRIKQVFSGNKFNYINNRRYYYNQILYNDGADYVLWLYFVLEDLFNGKENLYQALYQMKKIKPYYLLSTDLTYNQLYRGKMILLSDIIHLLDRKKIERSKNQNNMPHEIDIANLSFNYVVEDSYRNFYIKIETDLENTPIPFWNIFIEAFKEIDNIVQHPH